MSSVIKCLSRLFNMFWYYVIVAHEIYPQRTLQESKISSKLSCVDQIILKTTSDIGSVLNYTQS